MSANQQLSGERSERVILGLAKARPPHVFSRYTHMHLYLGTHRQQSLALKTYMRQATTSSNTMQASTPVCLSIPSACVSPLEKRAYGRGKARTRGCDATFSTSISGDD